MASIKKSRGFYADFIAECKEDGTTFNRSEQMALVMFNEFVLDKIAAQKKPTKDEVVEASIDEVIECLNEAWKTKFRKKTEANRSYIRGRFSDGHTKADMFAVVKHMGERWASDDKMAKYLRPITIFAPSKFEGYLNEIPRKAENLILVRDPFGNTKKVSEAMLNRAEAGHYMRIT